MWVQDMQNFLSSPIEDVTCEGRSSSQVAVSSFLVSSLLPNQVTKWGQKPKQINMFCQHATTAIVSYPSSGFTAPRLLQPPWEKTEKISMMAAQSSPMPTIDQVSPRLKLSLYQEMRRQKGPFLFSHSREECTACQNGNK